MSSAPEGQFVVATAYTAGSAGSAAFGVLSFLGTLFYSIPFLLVTLLLAVTMVPWVRYHDEVVETSEQFMRGYVYPVYRDTLRPIGSFLRDIFNPLACWIGGANYWAYGMIQDVIWPVVRDCNPAPVFISLGQFIRALFDDFVINYFLAQDFMTGESADFDNICDKWIIFFNAWIDLYSCTCQDLALLLRVLPIIPSVFFSEQWADPQTWCFISNLVNAAMELLRIALTLLQQILQAILSLIAPQSPFAQVNFTRPDFYKAVELLCRAASCGVRSIENAIQRFWDAFVPWTFVWSEYLCIVDSFICLVLKTVNWLLTLLVNIDKVIAYPNDQFWATTMRDLTVENLNLIAAPSNWATVQAPMPPQQTVFTIENFYLDTMSEFKLNGQPNPVFGKKRFSECLCLFIERTICDPSSTDTACFSNSAASLLRGLDFCCLTNTALTLVLDAVTAAYELTFHFTSGADQFFLFLDNQPFTTVLVDSITPLARCILSIFTLIPEVGVALQNLVAEAVCYLAATIDFAWRTVTGLASLPYFILEMPGTDNFLMQTGRAIDLWVSIQQKAVAETSSSLLNSACILLNTGFPIPPIPCSSCDKVGFIPLPPLNRRKRTFYNHATGKTDSPWTLAAEAMGWENPESAYLVTPPMTYYHQENKTQSLFNPFFLAKKIEESGSTFAETGYFPFPSHDDVDTFWDAKKQLLLTRWDADQKCRAAQEEALIFQKERPYWYKYHKQQGKYDCKVGGVYQEHRMHRWHQNLNATRNLPRISRDTVFFDEDDNETAHVFDARVTLGPTQAPTEGCSPNPPCFDLCCIVRSGLRFGAHLLEFIARFFNGFAQYEKERYGAQSDFPYFTGEFCEPQFNRDCFESDLVKGILLFFQNFSCLCRFINLVVPVSDDNPRGDLCCAIQRVSELFACVLQTLVNAIQALALGPQNNFAYYRQGLFFNDISAIFDVLLEVVSCACTLIRGIFPLNFIPGLRESVRFDPCCGPERLAVALVEALRFVTLSIISLATITVDDNSFCFFRLDTNRGCGPTLDDIGIVKRFDAIVTSLLPVSDAGQRGSCKDFCGKDQGRNGVVPCICEIFNTIIPWRDDPSKPVNCDPQSPDGEPLNCQRLDLCCFFVQAGFALEFAVRFLSRLTVALWQPWTPLPEFAIHYVFCEEDLPPDDFCGKADIINSCLYTGSMQPTPTCNCGTFTCGKLNPIINALAAPKTGLISQCVCELFSLLDDLLALVFESIGSSWSDCFCGLESGTLRTGPLVAQQLLTAVVGFLRKFPLPCYWQPAGRTFVGQLSVSGIPIATNCDLLTDPDCKCFFEKDPMNLIEESWIYSFLGPTAEALCISAGKLMCFINSIFFIPQGCLIFGEKFLGSTVRWGTELVFRIVAAIEGFVRQFTDDVPTCVGGDPMCADIENTGTYSEVGAAPLGRILTSLFTWFTDSLIGDSVVSCSRICPEGSLRMNTCDCWNLSPRTGAYTANGDPAVIRIVNGTDIFNNVVYACQVRTDQLITQGAADWANAIVGLKPADPPGPGAILPLCADVDDFGPESPSYPGSCANYNLCRPDSLPVCEVPEQVGQDVQSFNLEGPIDGQFNGLIRYIACAIDLGTDSKVGGAIARPILVFNSIIWQIYGAVMRFVAAIIIFILSFFNLTGGCECHNYNDPDYEDPLGVSSNEVRHTRGRVFTIGFCYPCPFTHGICGSGTGYPEPLECPLHCPYHQNETDSATAVNECIDRLNSYSDPDDWFIRDARALCEGTAQKTESEDYCGGPMGSGGESRDACLLNAYYEYATRWTRQASCAIPYCQSKAAGGTGAIFFEGIRARSTYTGSTNPSRPKVICSFVTLMSNFLDVLRAFAAIFTTPIIIPNSKRNSDAPASLKDFIVQPHLKSNGRESRYEFAKRMGLRFNYTQPTKDEELVWVADHYITNKEFKGLLQQDFKELVSNGPGNVARDTETFDRLAQRAHELQEAREHALKQRYSTGLAMNHAPYTTDGHSLTGVPSGPEQIALALWDFDTDDCFDDPVSCVCRNFNMKHHCTWDPQYGVRPVPISSAGRLRRRFALQRRPEWRARNTVNGTLVMPRQKRAQSALRKWRAQFASGARQKREEEVQVPPEYGTLNVGEDQMYPEEAIGMLTERFAGETPCDHTICGCALEEWDTMPHSTKEMFVQCISKRVQSERISDVTGGIVDADVMYHDQAPLFAFEKLVKGIKWKNHQIHNVKRKRSQKQTSKFAAAFPDLDKDLKERRIRGRKYLYEKKGFRRSSPMTEAVVKMDQIWYKYQVGFYGFLANETFRALREGDWHWPTTQQASAELHFAVQNLQRTVYEQPYRELWNHTAHATNLAMRFVRDVRDTGLVEYVKRMSRATSDIIEARAKRNEPRRERIWQKLKATPLYAWWSMPASEDKGYVAPFMRHLQRIVHGYRENWRSERNDFNFWSADLRAKGTVDDALNELQNPKFSETQLENWRQLSRSYYRIYDAVWPGHLDQELRERFLFTGNCLVLSKALDTTLQVADYCANLNARNFPQISERIGLSSYLKQTSHKRNSVMSVYVSDRYEWASMSSDPQAMVRLRLKPTQLTNETLRARSIAYNVSRSIYKRSTMDDSFQTKIGPAGFNFLAWITNLIEDIVSYMFSTNVEGWIDEARMWIKNPNTDEADYINNDVGLRYWLQFVVTCKFPDFVDCSSGVGLEPAVIWVTVGMLGAAIIGALIFPPITFLFMLIPAPFIWLALVGIIGLHYSPRCALLFPTITGFSSVLPLCLADEVIALTDKYITNCYSPLIIPACAISGDLCPADPNQFIDFVNCQLVGVSDGLQHVLFLLYILIGEGWADAVSIIANLGAFILPGAPQYVDQTFASFRMAYDTMRCRQWWCFGLTLPVISVPVLFLSIAFIALGILVPLLIALIVSCWQLFAASPFSTGLPGYDGTWDDPDADPGAEEVVRLESPTQETLQDIQTYIQAKRK